jgi:hypothetical protein
MESRREFLKKLGLFSSAVVATTIPLSAVASMVEKGIDHGQESILKTKIKVWCYKQICSDDTVSDRNPESKYFLSERECIVDELIWNSEWFSNPIGAMQNISYMTKELGKNIQVFPIQKEITLEEYIDNHIYPYTFDGNGGLIHLRDIKSKK